MHQFMTKHDTHPHTCCDEGCTAAACVLEPGRTSADDCCNLASLNRFAKLNRFPTSLSIPARFGLAATAMGVFLILVLW
jgi:hypothetical protein